VGKDQTSRDVCGPCNHGPLSKLDGYVRTLYDRYIRHWVVEGQEVELEYDYGKLLRWLMKLSYNSARTTGRDARMLAKHRSVLIEPNPVSPIFAVAWVGTIMPAHVLDPGASRFRRVNPAGARCGPIVIPGYEGLPDVFTRAVLINSYVFTLLVIDDPWLNANAHALRLDRRRVRNTASIRRIDAHSPARAQRLAGIRGSGTLAELNAASGRFGRRIVHFMFWY